MIASKILNLPMDQSNHMQNKEIINQMIPKVINKPNSMLL